jgi:hypothetical protein
VKRIMAATLLLGATLIVPSVALASSHKADPACKVNTGTADIGATYVLSAWGLPTGTAINLWVTTPDKVTTGSPLGSTPDGAFNLNESSQQSGTTTYTFSGPTKQRNTTVYATCSVDVY